MLLAFSFVLTGCTFNPIDWDIDSGYDNEDDSNLEPDYEFNISATLDTITIKTSGVVEADTNGNIVALKNICMAKPIQVCPMILYLTQNI